jgi:hypothetical protein
MSWAVLENGATVGSRGSENGVILIDEEHSIGARITLERDGATAPFSITCGIYGWMFHTRFLETAARAEVDFRDMKEALDVILLSIPNDDDPDVKVRMNAVSDAIAAFVDRFP